MPAMQLCRKALANPVRRNHPGQAQCHCTAAADPRWPVLLWYVEPYNLRGLEAGTAASDWRVDQWLGDKAR